LELVDFVDEFLDVFHGSVEAQSGVEFEAGVVLLHDPSVNIEEFDVRVCVVVDLEVEHFEDLRVNRRLT
jgi:hypothetical protein